MKPIAIVWAILALTCAPGCRGRGNQELLERELRWQEDRIYELESFLDDYEAKLAACDRADASAAPARKTRGNGDAPQRRRVTDAPLEPPEVMLPGEDTAPYDGPPLISPPDPDVPEGEAGPPRFDSLPSPSDEGSITPPRPDEVPAATPIAPDLQSAVPNEVGPTMAAAQSPMDSPTDIEEPIVPAPAGEEVTQLTLNQQLTAAHDGTGASGYEGVSVMLEPCDSMGGLLEVTGDISVAVLDPESTGPAVRVARWDFTAEEAANHFRYTDQGDGLYFDLPWPAGVPATRLLQLYARLTTADGRKLIAEQPIEIGSSASGQSSPDESAPSGEPGRLPAAATGGAKWIKARRVSRGPSSASDAPNSRADTSRGGVGFTKSM